MIKNYTDMVGYNEYNDVFIIQLGNTFFYTQSSKIKLNMRNFVQNLVSLIDHVIHAHD